MERITRQRTAVLVQKVCEILVSEPDGLGEAEMFRSLAERVPLTESERSPDPLPPHRKIYETVTQRGLIAPTKAGWVRVERGKWSATLEGQSAWAQYQDPERFVIEAGRLSVRGWLSVHCPGLYSVLCSSRYQLTIEARLVRRIGLRKLMRAIRPAHTSWKGMLPMQAPQRFSVRDLNFRGIDDILDELRKQGLAYGEGTNTVYIPPASVQRTGLERIVRYHPGNAGIKIVKNPGGAEGGSYVSRKHRHISRIHRRITYAHRHLSLLANFLYVEGIGPRLYDLVELEFDGQLWTAYVVEHVDGRTPTLAECQAGLEVFRSLEKRGRIRVTVPDGYEDEEFVCPACGGNALTDNSGRFRYLDFQNFLLVEYEAFLHEIGAQAIEASHYGECSLLRGGRYLYQSIPGVSLAGKRSCEQRAEALRGLMRDAGVSVQNRLVLDVGCNIGMMMAQYLKEGARWCHGWDRAHITPHTEGLLLAVGCTRFSTTGTDISQGRALECDLPEFLIPLLEGCVVSYLAVRRHLGWLDFLRRVPWSFLIYEGHEGETLEDFRGYMSELGALVKFRVVGVRAVKDGDGEERTLAILVREGK